MAIPVQLESLFVSFEAERTVIYRELPSSEITTITEAFFISSADQMEGRGSNAIAEKKEKWIMHYSSAHSILLVGEGDFSFSACLARSFGSAVNMVATSRDNQGDLMMKHSTAKNHLDELKGLGCKLLHGIDVKDMNDDRFLKTKRFDRIIFNFPHAGHDPSFREWDEELILRHRELLSNFFSSAKCLLSESGEIHVAHRDDGHYAQWRIRSLARRERLFLKEVAEFDKKNYPGYHNKRGGGIRSNKTFPLGHRSFTFKFSLKEDSLSLSLANLAIR